MNIGSLLKGIVKIATPIVVGMLTTKATRELERQAEKLTRKTDKL